MSTLYRISLVILTCYYVSACYAANYIWDGGGGDDNWSTSGNWSPDGTPNSSDIAIFDGTSDSNSTVDSGFTTSIGGIRMGPNYDGTVTLATPLGVSGSVVISGGTLDVSTSNYLLEAEGDFIVYGDGTFNARSGTVRLSGTGDESLQIDGSSLENLILNTAESGLVGWWKFDEVSGGTFADSSGNGNSGTGYGSSGVNNTPEPSIETPSTIRFRNPRSLDFDGTDDRVVVADTTPFDFAGEDTPFTLSLWVQLDSTGQQRLINKQRNVTNEFLFGIRVNSSSQFDFNIAKQNIAATRVTDPSTAETGKWYHLVGVSDGNEIAFYVNGELVDGPDTITISNANQTVADLNIGRFYNATQYTNGRIDDVRIYNRDLSANEIATLSSGKYGPSASSYTLGATLDVDGALHILNGTLNVSGGNYGISVAGDWYNAGSFESQNGTVTLNGTNQTLSGSTAFYNLTKTVASPATLTLDANGIHTVSGALNLMGASSNLLSLRSSTNGNEAYFYVDNDASDPALQYLNVQDMHSGSGATMECLTGSYECVNSGNNTNWVFAPTIAVTGTVHTDQGITDIGAGKTVALSVNGASAADTDDTDSNGFYSVSAAINVGDVLTLYLDDEAEDAVTVTVSSGSMMSGVHLYQNRLILKNETGGIITTTHLQTSDDNADNDVTELYSFNSNDLEVAKDTELYIWTNSTFTTDGRVTGHDTEIVGSLEMGSNTLVLSGSLVASSGTLETSGNLILMDTETTEILQLGSNAVHNIHIGSGSTASYAAVENGLTGAYYTGMNFDSLASTVVDSTVNFNPFDSTLQTRTGQSMWMIHLLLITGPTMPLPIIPETIQ